ncbi:MAG: hypothetical protein V1667_02500 [bacterium]
MTTQDKNNMKTSMQKPIIDAEAFMKFFEETTGAKFVDVKALEKNLKIINQKNNMKATLKPNITIKPQFEKCG